jgi:hypothetical protein
MIEQVMRQIMKYDAEFRREDAVGRLAPTQGTDERCRRVPSGDTVDHCTWSILSETDLRGLMPYMRSLRTRVSLSNFHVAVWILSPEHQAHLQCFDKA